MTTLGLPSTENEDRLAAAFEVIRREALRSGRSPRAVLSLIRLSDPPTQSESLVLAAIRLLRAPHAIMPHPCATFGDWLARYAPPSKQERPRSGPQVPVDSPAALS
jgi:hypothetical protein